MDSEAAWLKITEGLSGADQWWTKIVDSYNAADRHYHGIGHLNRKFELLNEIGGAHNIQALILALFFQYFEYDPRVGDTSEKNIEHLKLFAKDTGLDPEIVSLVEGLLATDGAGEDRALLQDLDIAALGSDPEEYNQLAQQVRKEYDFLSNEAYKSLRKKVLQSFLLIPSIFSTDAFHERFDVQARKNIESEVAELDKSS